MTGLSLLALTVVGSIVWSFGLYRQSTQNTYVFHHKGAAVSIYDERSSSSLPSRIIPYRISR